VCADEKSALFPFPEERGEVDFLSGEFKPPHTLNKFSPFMKQESSPTSMPDLAEVKSTVSPHEEIQKSHFHDLVLFVNTFIRGPEKSPD
jgi:hypothetical protein